MSKNSFKTFVAEALIEDKILKMVRAALGTDELDTTSEADAATLMKAKRVSHKFVDTAEGPWVVEVFTYRGDKYARVSPPKEQQNKKSTYFFPKEHEKVTESADMDGWSVSTHHYNTRGSDPTRIERFTVSKGGETIHIEQAFGDFYIYPKGFGKSAEKKGPLGEHEVDHFLKAYNAPSMRQIEDHLNSDDHFEDPMGHPSQYESLAEAGIPKHHEPHFIGPVHSSRLFHYDKGDKTFSAEASSLGRNWKGRIWNDAADEGFGIRSIRTDDLAAFTSMQEHKDGEGDITHWTFHVYNYSRDPKLNGVKAIVWND